MIDTDIDLTAIILNELKNATSTIGEKISPGHYAIIQKAVIEDNQHMLCIIGLALNKCIKEKSWTTFDNFDEFRKQQEDFMAKEYLNENEHKAFKEYCRANW